MKLVAFEVDGEVRHGRLDGDVVHDLGAGDLLDVVRGENADADGHTRPLASVRLLAPLLRPGKLLAAAANYQAHVTEGGGPQLDKSRLSPRLFLKPSTSISGPDDSVAVPSFTSTMDWEAELSVVVGSTCRDVPVDKALDQVFGYMASNDISARRVDFGYERDVDAAGNVKFFDWLEGKWPDGFAPCGPWLVTADEIPDPQALDLRLDLNGEMRQQSSTDAMIFTVAELISFSSKLMTLEPGDIIMTGTPSGTGASAKRFLGPGDVMTVTIEKLGSLTTKVVAP